MLPRVPGWVFEFWEYSRVLGGVVGAVWVASRGVLTGHTGFGPLRPAPEFVSGGVSGAETGVPGPQRSLPDPRPVFPALLDVWGSQGGS